MSAYAYRAARADGHVVRGVLDAPDAGRASAQLADMGLHPLDLATALPSRHRAASRLDLAIVFESLASLVNAGVPLERALASSEPVARGPLRETLRAARAALREGKGVAQALSTPAGVVPDVVLGMLRAGERGSALPLALEHVARHLEEEAALVAQVRQALAYPLVLAVVGTASVVVIGAVIVPRFAELLGEAGQDLPLATQLVLTGSAVLSHGWPIVLGLVATLVGVASQGWRRPGVRERVHDGLLRLPVVGHVRHALATARVARALGSMLEAGMPLLPAFDAAIEAAGDAAVAARLRRARERVTAGEGLTGALTAERALLAGCLPLVAVGEASGRLGAMAGRAGTLAAQEGARGLKTLVTLLEPALIVAFGGLVAFVAAALLQAVYSLRPGGF